MDTFASLGEPNYRRYSCGQAVSRVGTGVQMTAQAWLVLTLTHSATALGVTAALQTVPVLVLGAYGGVVADRVNKRKLMIALQSVMGVQALALGVLADAHAAQFWNVLVLSAALGTNNAFENPTRQAFVLEVVGVDRLRNAVTINSLLVNVGATIGPAVAGLLIVTEGVGSCFLANAVSFIPVVASLVLIDVTRVHRSPPSRRAKGQLREGLEHARSNRNVLAPLVMMALVGTFAYEFQVVLPVLATTTFHLGAGAYGLMTGALGAGAVVGGLLWAARGRTGIRALVLTAGGFGAMMVLAAGAPSVATEYLALSLVGWASISFVAAGNSTVQLASDPSTRGRTMALWAAAFQGTSAVGGPLVGLITSWAGPRAGLLAGGFGCFGAVELGILLLRRGFRGS